MLNYFIKIVSGLWSLLVGMKVTIKYLFKPAITLQYPDEKWNMPERFRGQLKLHVDKCIGCLACARACPDNDLEIVTHREEKKNVLDKFIWYADRCAYCGLCVDPCPTNAIVFSQDYEWATYTRQELYVDLLKKGKENKQD
ncbi:MAG: NADH-quinone oxidoreductase subunit I [bacterium]|nr:NADH-quinone oxidoreductase subunit I [bacterium]